MIHEVNAIYHEVPQGASCKYYAAGCWQPASQELRQREAANTSWRSPVRASAPFGLRRGAGANTVGVVVVVVVVVALVVVAHFAPRPPSA